MIGQETVFKQLKRIDNIGTVLILGPKGSGKTTLANEIILKEICEQSTGCRQCLRCRTFLSMNYPDFHLLEGGKVDDVRQLLGKISIKPYYEKHYVLVDDIDSMTVAAQNAMLKTLEEPVSPTLFILTGTIKRNILQTIISRSFVLSPHLLSDSVILEELIKRYPEEAPAFLETAAKEVEGCLGAAIDMVERKEFYQMLTDDINNIHKRNFFEVANRYKEYKDDIQTILSFYERHLRDVMLEKKEDKKTVENIYTIIRDMEKYRLQLKNNINPVMMFQNIILKIQAIKQGR